MTDCSALPTVEDAELFKQDSGTINEVVTSPNSYTDPASDGLPKKTLTGIAADAAAAIQGVGFINKGEFSTLPTIENVNEVAVFEGNFWLPTEPLPYTATGSSPLLPPEADKWAVAVTAELLGIARSLNCLNSQVIYSTDTATILDDVLYIYDAGAQIVWGVPALNGVGEAITSVAGSSLVTTGGTYQLVSVDTVNRYGNLEYFVNYGGLTLGMTVSVTDRYGALFDVVSGETPDGLGIIDATASGYQLKLRIETPHVYPEWYGAKDSVTDVVDFDNGDILLYALATKKRVVLDPDKIYGTTKEIAIKNSQRLRGGTRSYLDTNNSSAILWLGAASPVVAVVYMAQNDTRYTTNSSAVAYAECVDILIDGNNIADVGFYSNYTSSGTRINNVYAKNTNGCAILVTGCFYTEVDRLTGRGNNGAGVAVGNYTQTGLMTVTDSVVSAINALGTVNIEGHSNGKDLAWNHDTNNYVGFGCGLFGTINKCKFEITSEANEGSALIEEVNQGEFDVYGYVESSAKNNADSGLYSVQLLGSPTINSKSSIDILLRSNQRLQVNQSSRFYFIKLDGGDTGTGIVDNGAINYQLSPKSRFNYVGSATSMHEKVLAKGELNFDNSSAFTVQFYVRAIDRCNPVLRVVQYTASGDVSNFNVRISVDGAVITTKGLNIDNKAAYEATEISLNQNNGLFELKGTQAVGVTILGYYEVVAREKIEYSM